MNLEDTIIALQVCTGLTPASLVCKEADVNGDSKISLPEAIYALQWIAGFYNNAPILEPIGNKIIEEGESLSFQVMGTDSDGDDLTFMVSNLPGGATFDPNTRTFSWTPTYSQSGTYNVTFTVMDSNGDSDSETITITVNDKTPVFNTIEYFLLNVGDWWNYKINGSIEQTKISGIKSIGGVNTRIMLYADGSKEYYTSDQNGVKLYGTYVTIDGYTYDIIFEIPLLLMPDNANIGTTQVSTSAYSFTIYDYTFHVDITSTTKILGLEDVVTENSTLRDCIKVSTQSTEYIRETGDSITGDTTYYWFYKNIGCVKQMSGSDTYIITESYVNGVNKTY